MTRKKQIAIENSKVNNSVKKFSITVSSNKLSNDGIKNLFFAMDKFIETLQPQEAIAVSY
jgi:hypothetical protein